MSDEANAVLQVRELSKRFGSKLAVDCLSIDVAQGEIFGFLGPNGAGKTTAINMMIGLLEPTAGDVLIEGQSVLYGRAAALRRVGVCPQENSLWEKLTCLEQLEFMGVNYGLGARYARSRGAELLASLGLAQKANELAGRLSGGMKRRLSLALALVHDPHLIFLDEPEAGLDPQSRVLVRDTIRRLAHRKTVVLTTHNMDEADRIADRIAIMDHGRLLVADTPEALKRRLGEGDVLEIELEFCGGEDDGAASAALLEALKPPFGAAPQGAASQGAASLANGLLTLHGADLSTALPRLLPLVQAFGWRAGSIRMRAVTLEDVFLALTGRGLRE